VSCARAQLVTNQMVRTVLDWELATLGEPMADLATMLTNWHDAADTERAGISVAAGLTTPPGSPSQCFCTAGCGERLGYHHRHHRLGS
jgi:Phosphotransferase enzyme family